MVRHAVVRDAVVRDAGGGQGGQARGGGQGGQARGGGRGRDQGRGDDLEMEGEERGARGRDKNQSRIVSWVKRNQAHQRCHAEG